MPKANFAMNNVAMLIDWENIKASAMDHLHTPPDIITLKKIARQYGSLRIARAYANWTDSSGWHAGDVERLSAQGIEPVFVATKHLSRGFGEQGNRCLYEKDMVDLRLACDGMELLSMHPEIGCYVVVSGDGALATVLAKLSARGKRVVRVSIENALTKGMNVLGEERVIYDDWVKGFRLSDNADVTAAVARLAEAVKAIIAACADCRLNAVKDWMRRDEPDFDEENLGIPTFRHLAYLAESRGLVRIDATTEPAQAHLATDDGFPSGDTWRSFIGSLDASKEYNRAGLEASLENVDLGLAGASLKRLCALAVESDVVVSVPVWFVTRDRDSQQALSVPSQKYRLNSHHPRVQVVLAGRGHSRSK
jgi:uncharacterized LabA/DUF88 family protein